MTKKDPQTEARLRAERELWREMGEARYAFDCARAQRDELQELLYTSPCPSTRYGIKHVLATEVEPQLEQARNFLERFGDRISNLRKSDACKYWECS